MMTRRNDRIALRGPLLSGKTTLAQALEEVGLILLNYTDLLKSYAAAALSNAGEPTSVADIKGDKEKYRRFLQELGTLTGFDQGRPIPELVRDLSHGDGYVFDNVRFLEQWEALKPYGFVLVQLDLSPMEQERRAVAKGLSPEGLGRALAHPAEIGFPTQPGEIVLDASLPTADLIEELLSRLDSRQAAA